MNLFSRQLLVILSTTLIVLVHSLALPATPLLEEPWAVVNNTDLNLPNENEDIDCFAPDNPAVTPLELDKCRFAFEFLARDPDATEARVVWTRPHRPGTRAIPDEWGIDGCYIVIYAEDEPTVDNIRLVAIGNAARAIIDRCPGESKRDLGGTLAVGNGRSFFVLVNGKIGEPSMDAMMRKKIAGSAVLSVPGGRTNV